MSEELVADNSLSSKLILFVTDGAPRSGRARDNLSAALIQKGLDGWPREIDLLKEPGQALAFGMFATPALLRIGADGPKAVLYGDFSDTGSLMRFLEAL
ncbi:hypothetical protein [Halomonas aquatica]|uniref:KaiB domain-containing protein n=1 Tax=Halomonas aquatica TaxID=3151123 RepID=A0ABV1NGM0_9GAMM